MNKRQLGRTGLSVSEISLGTWAFASQVYGDVGIDDARSTVDAAIDAGVNFFDTAPLYGDENQNGISEIILGQALGTRRDDVLISTKFGRYSTNGGAGDFSAQRARESVEGSLKRLGTDVLDVVFFHSPFGPEDIQDDVWGELDALKAEGKIRFIGHSISLFEKTEGMARQWAEERKIDVIQVVLSLMNRQSEKLIHNLGESGIGIVARECLANGFLTGAINKDTVFPANNLNNRYSREEIVERVNYVDCHNFLVRDDIHSIPQVAMRWILDNPNVSTVLTGARNKTELLDCAQASQAKPFSRTEHHKIDGLHTKDFPAA